MKKTWKQEFDDPDDFANKSSIHAPSFERDFGELASFYIQLYSSLEESVPLAKKYFEDLKTSIEVYLLNQLIRFNTKRLLNRKRDINLKEDDYEMGDLSNNGLVGTCRGHNVRILKSYNSGLPLANSYDKTKYFNQQLTFIIGESMLLPTGLNVVFVWDLSDKYELKPLRMCCPKYAERYRGILSTYYDEVLPHPAEIIKARPEIVDEIKDIEIRTKEVIDDKQDIHNIWGENQASPGTEQPDSK
jgi:hypothetical protein